MTHPKANSTSFKPGNKSGGRPVKTPEERAGYAYLSERTVQAAERLFELETSADPRIALGAVTAHLKIVIGDLQREAGADGESKEQWTKAEILEVIRSGR